MMRKAPHNGCPTPPRTTPTAQGHNHTLKHDKTRKKYTANNYHIDKKHAHIAYMCAK